MSPHGQEVNLSPYLEGEKGGGDCSYGEHVPLDSVWNEMVVDRLKDIWNNQDYNKVKDKKTAADLIAIQIKSGSPSTGTGWLKLF